MEKVLVNAADITLSLLFPYVTPSFTFPRKAYECICCFIYFNPKLLYNRREEKILWTKL